MKTTAPQGPRQEEGTTTIPPAIPGYFMQTFDRLRHFILNTTANVHKNAKMLTHAERLFRENGSTLSFEVENEPQNIGNFDTSKPYVIPNERYYTSLLKLAGFPAWAPMLRYRERAQVFTLLNIIVNAQWRGAGVGRLLLNAIQQSLTQNSVGPQWFCVDYCHMPLFFVIDSHYRWLKYPFDTPFSFTTPDQMFPRYHPVTKKPEDADKRKANAIASWAPVNLLWSTPLLWWINALLKVYQLPPDTEKDIVEAVHAFCENVNSHLAEPDQVAQPHAFGWNAQLESVFTDPLTFHLSTAPLKQALPAAFHPFAQHVHEHCVKLGNVDAEETVALLLHDSSLIESKRPSNFDWLTLDYFINHCRVMFRPIILSDGLLRLLCNDAAEELEDDALRASFADAFYYATHENPRPYLTRLTERSWIWIPVKKPHSTTPDGSENIPLIEYEDAPLYVTAVPKAETDEGPVFKKPRRGGEVPEDRFLQSCLHCRSKNVTLAAGFNTNKAFAFCSAACHTDYYCGHEESVL